MKTNKTKSGKKGFIGIGALVVVTGFVTPILINVFSKEKEEVKDVEVFEPHGDIPFDINQPLYNYDKDGKEFTTDQKLAFGYQDEVLPTSVLIPGPTGADDSLIIDGQTHMAEENTLGGTPALPEAVDFYKDKNYTTTNLSFTTIATEAIDYVAAKVPPVAQLKNPADENDVVTIDGVPYSAVINSVSGYGGGKLPDETIYRLNENNNNNFTTVKTSGLGYEYEVPMKNPELYGVTMTNIEGAAQYDSTKGNGEVVPGEEPVAGVDAKPEVKPSIDLQEIPASNGGDPYDSSLGTGKLEDAGTPGTDAIASVQPKVRVSDVAPFISLDVGFTEPTATYDPTLGTYGTTVNVTHNDNFSIGGYPHYSKVQEIEAYYDNTFIGLEEITWVSINPSFITPDLNDPSDGQMYSPYLTVFGGITDFTLVPVQNIPIYPIFGDKLFEAGKAMVPPNSGDDPQKGSSGYNGVEMYIQDFPYSGSTIKDTPVDGDVPTAFDISAYDAGKAPEDRTDGTPGKYKPLYNGFEIAALSQKTVENHGSTIGAAPTNEQPSDFDISNGDEGVSFVPEVLPEAVIININDYGNGEQVTIAMPLSQTIPDTTIYLSVEFGLDGGDTAMPIYPEYFEEAPGVYVTVATDHKDYEPEVFGEIIDIYSSVTTPETSITIKDLSGTEHTYSTAKERYVFNVEITTFYSVEENSNKYTTDHTGAFDYQALILPESVTGRGATGNDKALLDVAMANDDRKVVIHTSDTETVEHIGLEG